MRVLLLGEYSGFHTNLKKGLEKLGVECIVASNGDGWKKINGIDLSLWPQKHTSTIGRKFDYNIAPLIQKRQFHNFDIVQFVNPELFSTWINKIMLADIISHSKKSFVSVCGDTYNLYKVYKERLLDYYVYDNNPLITSRYDTSDVRARRRINQENWLYDHVDGIIPVMYEYAKSVINFNNIKPTIPLPFDASSIPYCDNVINGKITILHGLIKEVSKGSKYIIDALDIIKQRYPNDVDIIVDGKMPLNDYLNLLRKSNILIDQCKEHCWGMNACYGMAMGRIVLGGASENSLKEFGLDSSPVYHITPNTEQIVAQIENVISQRQNFKELGLKSRKFVEEFHDCERIAQMYLDLWTK